MRFSTRVARLAVALACTLLLGVTLSACVPDGPPVVPTTTASAQPIFASEDEALAAAVKAYKKYLAVSESITEDGGEDSSRISPYVSAEFLPAALDSFKPYVSEGLRTIGSTAISRVNLENYTEVGSRADVDFYVCTDITALRVLDSAGKDVTPAKRTDVLPLEIRIQFPLQSVQNPVLSRSDVWSGDNFCAA